MAFPKPGAFVWPAVQEWCPICLRVRAHDANDNNEAVSQDGTGCLCCLFIAATLLLPTLWQSRTGAGVGLWWRAGGGFNVPLVVLLPASVLHISCHSCCLRLNRFCNARTGHTVGAAAFKSLCLPRPWPPTPRARCARALPSGPPRPAPAPRPRPRGWPPAGSARCPPAGSKRAATRRRGTLVVVVCRPHTPFAQRPETHHGQARRPGRHAASAPEGSPVRFSGCLLLARLQRRLGVARDVLRQPQQETQRARVEPACCVHALCTRLVHSTHHELDHAGQASAPHGFVQLSRQRVPRSFRHGAGDQRHPHSRRVQRRHHRNGVSVRRHGRCQASAAGGGQA